MMLDSHAELELHWLLRPRIYGTDLEFVEGGDIPKLVLLCHRTEVSRRAKALRERTRDASLGYAEYSVEIWTWTTPSTVEVPVYLTTSLRLRLRWLQGCFLTSGSGDMNRLLGSCAAQILRIDSDSTRDF